MVEQRDRYGCRSTYKKKTSKNFVFIDIAQKCNYVQNITALVLTFITMLKQSMIDCFSWRYHGNFLKICTNALTCSSAIQSQGTKKSLRVLFRLTKITFMRKGLKRTKYLKSMLFYEAVFRLCPPRFIIAVLRKKDFSSILSNPCRVLQASLRLSHILFSKE